MQIFSDLVGAGVSFALQNGRSASNIKVLRTAEDVGPYIEW